MKTGKFLANPRNLAIAFGFIVLAESWSLADDNFLNSLEIQGSLEKKVYQNVRIVGVTDKGLKITHDAGIAVIPIHLVPKNIADKYKKESVPMEKPIASSGDEKQTADSASAEIVNSFEPSCLVFIQTQTPQGVSSGTGFIAKYENKYYVYTNAHVLCGGPGGFTKRITSVKTATGRTIATPHELQLSEEFDENNPNGLEDVARFRVQPKDGESAYDLDLITSENIMKRKVIAYGNSHGAGVMTELEGDVVAVGNDRIEVSCEIVPGNSGGPVVIKDTNKVIGVSTYLTYGKRDIWAKDTKFEKVRRFAVLPQKIKKWRTMQYTSLISALEQLNSFEYDTLSLAAACYLDPKPNRGGFDVPTVQKGDFIIREIIMNGAANPLGASIHSGIRRVNERIGSTRALLSMQAAVPIFAEFFSTVANKSKAQINDIKTADRAPYMKQFLNELAEQRIAVQEQFLLEWSTRYR